MNYKVIMASLLMALSAGAVADHHQGKKMFTQLDINGDGLLSVDEFQTRRGDAMFTRGDTDKDGIVTVEELRARHQEQQARMEARLAEKGAEMLARIESLDQNRDGTIMPEEARLATFAQLDENEDGYLSKDELRQARDRDGRGPKRMGKARGMGEGKRER